MPVSNDTVSTAHDIGDVLVGSPVIYDFENPPWDFDSEEEPIYAGSSATPDGVCWLSFELPADLWLTWQLVWVNGAGDRDPGQHGHVSVNLFTAVGTPAHVSDLTPLSYGGYGLSGGLAPDYVVVGQTATSGTIYAAVAVYDPETDAAVTAGLTLRLLLAGYTMVPPEVTVTAVPIFLGGGLERGHIAASVVGMPGEAEINGGIYPYPCHVDYGDGSSSSGVSFPLSTNHDYAVAGLPATVTVTVHDYATGLDGSSEAILALLELPDVFLNTAAVRPNVRLSPAIPMRPIGGGP